MTDHAEPGDEYVGKTFEEDLAELNREIEDRRDDKGLQDRISRRLKEDAPVLERLKDGGD